MGTTKLLPCPFCGGQAGCEKIEYGLAPGYRIRCVRCQSSSPIFYSGYDLISERDLSLEEIRERATKAWNNRKGVPISQQRVPA